MSFSQTPRKQNTEGRASSCPNMNISSEVDIRRLYSLSLSQLKKYNIFKETHFKPAPFNLRWVYGHNHKANVLNLNLNGSTLLFYAASNCGILYNWTKNNMRILQGHKHVVTTIACDSLGRWLVTAGSGAENIIVIWDSTDYFPQRTIFSPHGAGKLSKVSISADAKYLLSLAYTDKADLHWWIWSEGEPLPHVRVTLTIPKDSIISMDFNPFRSDQFLLLSKSDIWIGHSKKIVIIERGVYVETDKFEIKMQKAEKHINPEFGKLTCFAFVKDTQQILVPTSRGRLWAQVVGWLWSFSLQSVNVLSWLCELTTISQPTI